MKKAKKSSKKTKGRNKRISIQQSIGAGIILLILVILICKVFVWETELYVSDETQMKVEDAAKACAYRFEKKLSEYEQMLKVMVSCLPDTQEVLNNENLKSLKVMKDIDYV